MMKANSIVQALLSRTGLSSILGMQMGGLRNLYQTFGWQTKLTHQHFVIKYKRGGVAKRVVNSFPDAMWSDPPLFQGDEAFNKAWQDVLANTPVFAYLQKLDKLCRLGTFAIMIIGIDDGKKLDTPASTVTEAGVARKIIYLQPYSEGSVEIKEYEKNTASKRFRLPTMYTVSPGSFDQQNVSGKTSSISAGMSSFDVHWTRVLHVAEGALESPVFGTSCLESIYNDLDDLEKISGGSAEIFWLNARQGLHIDIDKDMNLKSEDTEALAEEVDEYSNNLRRVIRTRGVKVTNIGSDFLDPSRVYDVPISNIAASTGLPKRVLSGSEAGQLASQQDRANWSNRVEERVAEYGNPVVVLPFLRLLIDIRVLPAPSSLTITWPDAFKMNPLERAQTSAQMARSAANLAKTLFTVQQINHANAVDSRPTVMPAGGGFGGSFAANADPTKSSSGTSKTPNPAPKDPKGSGDNKGTEEPQTIEQPALFDKKPTTVVLLTEDECRSIIGFGKHMPVFDSKQDTTASIGSSTSESGLPSLPQE